MGREERSAPRFAGRVVDYDVTVRSLAPLLDRAFAENVVSALLLSLVRNMTVQFEDHDLIGFVISSPSLRDDIGIPLTRYDQFSLDRLLAILEQLIQSNEQVFLFEGGFTIRIIHIQRPQGGRNKENQLPLDKFIRNNRRFLRIENQDELCCARALVVAMAFANKDGNPVHYQKIRRQRGQLQEEEARQLHAKAEVKEGRCGIPEVEKFQHYLGSQGYQIVVYGTTTKHGLLYKGPENTKMLILFLHNNHFDVILSLPMFLGKSYFCTICFQGYDAEERHKCINTCNCCKQNAGCTFEEWKTCKTCNRVFKSQACFDRHRESSSQSKSICEKIFCMQSHL